ncbi:MAG: hypothetical protein AABY53_08905 [Bdellovibrionota bacterium]
MKYRFLLSVIISVFSIAGLAEVVTVPAITAAVEYKGNRNNGRPPTYNISIEGVNQCFISQSEDGLHFDRELALARSKREKVAIDLIACTLKRVTPTPPAKIKNTITCNFKDKVKIQQQSCSNDVILANVACNDPDIGPFNVTVACQTRFGADPDATSCYGTSVSKIADASGENKNAKPAEVGGGTKQ